jgi:hypothetical protein
MPTYMSMIKATTTGFCPDTFPHKQLAVLCTVFLLTAGLSCRLHSSDMNNPNGLSPKVGGPCEYKDYKGEAEIVSVQRIDSSSASARLKQPDELYKVTYSFYPEKRIQENFVHIESRRFDLLREDSSYPDLGFIQRNGINPGKKLKCVLQVITKGACTPMIFKFPNLK